MTEVSSWSPTDASNNLTPPDGWPEGMQPSGVNDVGRMMMGALKRMHTTVTAGIANSLPLSGGTLTGNLTLPSLHATGDITGSNLIATTATFTPYLNVSANIATHTLHADGDIYSDANVSAGTAMFTPYLNVSANIATHTLQADGDISTDANVTAGIAMFTPYLNVSANIATATLQATGAISSNTDIIAGGNLNVTGTATANSLTTSALVNTVTYQLSGNNFVTRRTDGAGTCNAIFDGLGGLGIDLYGPGGSFYRCDNTHWFTNRAATSNVCGFVTTGADAGNTFNASGAWRVFSDAALKRDITDYRAGLPEVLKLNPRSFRYTDDAPFGNNGRAYYGLIAQEVEPVLPEMVGRARLGDGPEYATMSPTQLVFVLINAVKELEARLAQVENRGG